MSTIQAIIFDMDGTLYAFDDNEESAFASSQFGQCIRANILSFLQKQCALSANDAEKKYLELQKQYAGHISLACEKELGVSRNEYFAATWNVPAERFLQYNDSLAQLLSGLSVRAGLLTAAPQVWTEKVLDFLQIRSLFGEAIFTGESDLRKPNPAAFLQLAQYWNLEPKAILAIGDQEQSDILPAKEIGMKTLRIAKHAQTQADFIAPDIVSALNVLKKKGMV
ncbi:HAD family hydrolase [Candidatus Woesebacteria bacterium]|nr:HAD family hydrolase [Candidatus Woesebacteria bacterium]MCD8527393.1 HAD family hydrolase [Candidatus Woesebacteria bacterium]